MPRPLPLTILPILGLSAAGVATADVPAVVTDIAPVHSLAAIVMDGVGAPELLVEPGASPHGYALRPSQARSLDAADVVFWIGEGLEPWLVGPIDTLASDAHVIELGESEGTLALPFRTGATFGAHDHEDDHADEGAHGDDDHDEHEHEHDDDHGGHDHDHDEHAHAEDGHDHGEEDHAPHDHDHGHDHQGQDPHAWLDPENARTWLQVIATELAEIDPANAETYRANAEAGRVELAALIDEVSAGLAPVRGRPFIVFHDAYQYFENRFDISAQGAISLGDASDPSPARIADVRGKVLALDAHCAFAEPQHNPDLIATVFEGVEARTGTLDPLGADLAPGAALYPQLIRNLATAFTECLR